MQPIFAELSSARALVPISSLGILAAKRETSFGLRIELLYVSIFVGALVQLTHPTFEILGQSQTSVALARVSTSAIA